MSLRCIVGQIWLAKVRLKQGGTAAKNIPFLRHYAVITKSLQRIEQGYGLCVTEKSSVLHYDEILI